MLSQIMSLSFRGVRIVQAHAQKIDETRTRMTEEQRTERNAQLARTMALLVHASGCADPECPSSNCSKVKGLFHHAVSCPQKVAGGCQLCRCARTPPPAYPLPLLCQHRQSPVCCLAAPSTWSRIQGHTARLATRTTSAARKLCRTIRSLILLYNQRVLLVSNEREPHLHMNDRCPPDMRFCISSHGPVHWVAVTDRIVCWLRAGGCGCCCRCTRSSARTTTAPCRAAASCARCGDALWPARKTSAAWPTRPCCATRTAR